MPQVRLARKALDDLGRLHRFLASKDAAAAGRAIEAIEAIEAAFLTLETFPEICRIADEDSELRELTIEFGNSGYLALYFWDQVLDGVIVLAVKHQLEKNYGLDV